MDQTRRLFLDLLADEQGATAVEYGLIAALVIVALLMGLTNFTNANEANYQLIESKLVH